MTDYQRKGSVSIEEGKDWLEGGFGNDTIYSVSDTDLTLKDIDADVFVLAPSSGTDTIYGFDPTKDVIYLSKGLTFAFIKIEGDGNGNSKLIDLDTGDILAVFMGIAPNEITRANVDEENVQPNRLEFESKKPIYAKDETVTLVNTVVRDANGASDIERIDFWLQKDSGNWQDISDVGFKGIDGSVAWGDYNKDGFSDLLIAGQNDKAGSYPIRLYKNNGNGTFSEVNLGLPDLTAYRRGVTWGDYNNDGNLDILGSGYIIPNVNGKFDAQNIIHVSSISSSDKTGIWQDYDKDSDLDLLLSGKEDVNGAPFIKLYTNNGNNAFTETNFSTNISGLVYWNITSSANQILAVGKNASNQLVVNTYSYNSTTKTYSTTPTSKVLTTPQNKPITPDSVDWYDYNKDGVLDFVLTGSNGSPDGLDAVTLVYKGNSDGTFTLAAELTGVVDGDSAWGELNGKATLLVTGNSNQYRTRAEDLKTVRIPISKVYQFDTTTIKFVEISTDLTGVYHQTQGNHVSWQDYDKDSDLDILLTGKDFFDNPVTLLYKNDAGKFVNAVFNPLVTDPRLSTFNYSLNGLTPGDYILKGTAYDHETAAQEYTLVPGSGEGTGSRALVLDGGDDYVNLTNPGVLHDTGNQTIEMWVKPANFNNRSTLYHVVGFNPPGTEIAITIESDGTVSYSISGQYIGGNGFMLFPYQYDLSTSKSLQANQWVHLAIVTDSINQNLYWYINGEKVNESSINYPNNYFGYIDYAHIGERYGQEYFAGQIDEVRVWNVARTQQQIQENMNRQLTGSQTGLAGYWSFDQVNAGTVVDLSGNNHNGQLLNGAKLTDFATLKGTANVSVDEWSKQWTQGDINSITTDGSNNFYSAGNFSGTINISGQALTSNGANDIFIAKFDNQQNLLWAKNIGNADSDYVRSGNLTTDSSGNLYTAGDFNNTINIGGQSLTSNGASDVFITKLDTQGNTHRSHSIVPYMVL
jgi:hypothetical protein